MMEWYLLCIGVAMTIFLLWPLIAFREFAFPERAALLPVEALNLDAEGQLLATPLRLADIGFEAIACFYQPNTCDTWCQSFNCTRMPIVKTRQLQQ